jgi:diguanylate cyclase (GGDEF)-like protein
MNQNITKLLRNTLNAIGLSYRIVRGIDYRTLSHYILKINRHKEIDAILLEVSTCLKDILEYELFGFALKNGNSMDVWIDPRAFSMPFADFIKKDFDCQNIDVNIHYFEKKTDDSSHNSDTINVNNLMSYNVIEGQKTARLYILPRKKMLNYHDSIINTIVNSLSIAVENNLCIQHLKNAAAIDSLTGCYNRRALDCFIENDFAYALRNGNDLSVIMMDIDNFKEINDVHGHPAGDVALKEISSLISSLVRRSDYVARYGGEEFIIILPDTNLYSAVQLADKIRKKIEGLTISCKQHSFALTASFGVAGRERKPNAESLVREADDRLYKAKSLGKNTVVPSMLPCFADRNFVQKTDAVKFIDAARVC